MSWEIRGDLFWIGQITDDLFELVYAPDDIRILFTLSEVDDMIEALERLRKDCAVSGLKST